MVYGWFNGVKEEFVRHQKEHGHTRLPPSRVDLYGLTRWIALTASALRAVVGVLEEPISLRAA
jgi:hypothetical protein